jgi:hypothetical protein
MFVFAILLKVVVNFRTRQKGLFVTPLCPGGECSLRGGNRGQPHHDRLYQAGKVHQHYCYVKAQLHKKWILEGLK